MSIEEMQDKIKDLSQKVDLLIRIVLGGAQCAPPSCVSAVTLFEWLSKWLETQHKPNVSESVYKNDCGIIRNHVFAKVEYDKPLSEFKPLDLQALINDIYSSRQRVIASNMLVSAFRSAYDNDLMTKDITLGIKKPKHEYKQERALTANEEKKLLKAICGHKLELYIKVLLYAGLRRSEALGLVCGDLDFERSEIHIIRQVTRSGEFTEKLKTKSSKRTVKMFPWLKEVLLPFKTLSSDVRLFDFMPDYVSHKFADLCSGIKIVDFSLKGLRTTFATRCEERGIPDSIIQAWLGHTSFKTTKQHYIRLNSEFIDSEFKRVIKRHKTP